MGRFVFNNAKGRVAEFYWQAKYTGSPRGIGIVPVDRGADSDPTMKTRDTLADLLGGTTNEVSNTIGGDGLKRKILTSTGTGALLLPALSYDVAHAWMPCDAPDQTWVTPSAGGAWTDLIWCYIPNVATSPDSDWLCLVCSTFAFTPDGVSNAVAGVDDFYRAA